MNIAWSVFKKEWLDAIRDRKTLISVLLSSVIMGPIILFLISTIVSDMETQAERRGIVVEGMEYAPTLKNYLERQTMTIKPAPAGFEQALRDSTQTEPVLVIPKDFEEKLAKGEAPEIEVLSASNNRNAASGAGRIARILEGFNRERSAQGLALRGIPIGAMKAVEVQERDVATAASRSAQITSMIPFFIILAVLYGALNAALDTTAGERERGSLEPLLTNPSPHWQLVLGKWGAVAAIGMLIAVLSALSFFPAQALLKSETLRAMFQYGWKEALIFIVALVPFAAAIAAMLMAVAIRCKTFKEAQANNTFVILGISLLPLVTLMGNGGEKAWHLWLPGLGQNALMTRVLKGEALDAMVLLAPTISCVVISILGIMFISKSLQSAAVR
jgi:sodium transport system permease protein